jgi:predicted LPLAT superfamily acyltransferase
MEIRRRTRVTDARPFVTRADAVLAAELPLLALIALVVPEPRWRPACRRLEAVKARLRLVDPGPVARIASRVVGGGDAPFDATSFALDVAAGRSEHHVQVLRASLGRWRPRLALEGEPHIASALRDGRGAVLWVAHFCFNALATKQALSSAGYRAWHLSRPEHGFSSSRAGIATVNRIRVRAELAQLAGRLVIDRAKPAIATLAAQRVLRGNGIVSITAGAWEGTRLARVALLGGTLELAVGAPGLARIAGAALLPVFTVKDDDGTHRIVVDPPLAVPRDGDANAALGAAAQAFADRLETFVRRYPSQWRDWKSLALPP